MHGHVHASGPRVPSKRGEPTRAPRSLYANRSPVRPSRPRSVAAVHGLLLPAPLPQSAPLLLSRSAQPAPAGLLPPLAPRFPCSIRDNSTLAFGHANGTRRSSAGQIAGGRNAPACLAGTAAPGRSSVAVPRISRRLNGRDRSVFFMAAERRVPVNFYKILNRSAGRGGRGGGSNSV